MSRSGKFISMLNPPSPISRKDPKFSGSGRLAPLHYFLYLEKKFVCALSINPKVWFQNRRSKERRMKQLSALGVRRQFYRNPRRLRALRPGEDLADDLGQTGFNYFVGQWLRTRLNRLLTYLLTNSLTCSLTCLSI